MRFSTDNATDIQFYFARVHSYRKAAAIVAESWSWKKNEMEMDPKNSHFGVKSITLEWNVLDVVVIVVFFVVFAQVKTYINCEAVARLKTRKGKNTTKS